MVTRLLLRPLLCAVLSGFVAAAPAAWVPLRLAERGSTQGDHAPERRDAPASIEAPHAFKAEERPRTGRPRAQESAGAGARWGADAASGSASGPYGCAAAPGSPHASPRPRIAAAERPVSLPPGRALLRADLRAGHLALPPPPSRA